MEIPGRRTRLRASLGGVHERITCGAAPQRYNQENRVVKLACGDGIDHAIYARCALVEVSTGRTKGDAGGTQALLVCSESECGTRISETRIT